MLQIAAAYDTDSEKALMVYSDRYDEQGLHPTIDYQKGALRDDFDFGSLVLFRSADVKNFLKHDVACNTLMPRCMPYDYT